MSPGNDPTHGKYQQNVNDISMLADANYMLQKTIDKPCVTWYYKTWEFGVVKGPVDSNGLIRLFENGELSGSALCWRVEKYAPHYVYRLEDII